MAKAIVLLREFIDTACDNLTRSERRQAVVILATLEAAARGRS